MKQLCEGCLQFFSLRTTEELAAYESEMTREGENNDRTFIFFAWTSPLNPCVEMQNAHKECKTGKRKQAACYWKHENLSSACWQHHKLHPVFSVRACDLPKRPFGSSEAENVLKSLFQEGNIVEWKHPTWVENAHKWHSGALGKCGPKTLHFPFEHCNESRPAY